LSIPTYTVSIHGQSSTVKAVCTVKAANPEDAVRTAVRRLWDEITPPFEWGVDVTDGKSRWPYQVFACGASDRANRWTIVVGP